MRRVILTVASVLAGSASASAQYYDYEDDGAATDADYEAYFGDGPDSQSTGQSSPSSLAEARKLGRAYRIGDGAGTGKGPQRDVHVVQDGDTLWNISTHYYGDPWRWPQVWSYNPEVTNPHWIYPLDQIRLTEETYRNDEAAALAATGRIPPSGPASEGAGLKVIGSASDAGSAPTVKIDPQMLKPDTIFLRDVGYLDKDALPKVGQVIGGFEEQMFLTNSDQVYVKFNEKQDVRAGQQYTVFRRIDESERTPEQQGELVRIFGTVLIRSYDRDKHVARAVITETLDPIERGFMVAKLERRFDLVPPRRNEKEIEAKVIASARALSLLSHDEVVFLDVGADKGVQPGNRFFVMRKGDHWLATLERQDPEQMGSVVEVPEYDESQFPEEVVAELRVVKVQKTTTVAVIVRSDTDVFIGDRVQMRKGF